MTEPTEPAPEPRWTRCTATVVDLVEDENGDPVGVRTTTGAALISPEALAIIEANKENPSDDR